MDIGCPTFEKPNKPISWQKTWKHGTTFGFIVFIIIPNSNYVAINLRFCLCLLNWILFPLWSKFVFNFHFMHQLFRLLVLVAHAHTRCIVVHWSSLSRWYWLPSVYQTRQWDISLMISKCYHTFQNTGI